MLEAMAAERRESIESLSRVNAGAATAIGLGAVIGIGPITFLVANEASVNDVTLALLIGAASLFGLGSFVMLWFMRIRILGTVDYSDIWHLALESKEALVGWRLAEAFYAATDEAYDTLVVRRRWLLVVEILVAIEVLMVLSALLLELAQLP